MELASFTFYFEFKPIIIFFGQFNRLTGFWLSLKHCAFRFSRTCSLLSSPKSVLDGPDPNQDPPVGPWSWTNWGFLIGPSSTLDGVSDHCPVLHLLELSCQIRAPIEILLTAIFPPPQKIHTKDLSRDSVRVNSKITFSLQSLLLFRINMFQQIKNFL